jgi:hypothetical protein
MLFAIQSKAFWCTLTDFKDNCIAEPSSVEQNHISEPATADHISEPATAAPEDVDGEEVYNPPEKVEDSIEEEEAPIAEVVDQISDDWQIVVEPNSKMEEVPKKSYASIVSYNHAKSYAYHLFLIHFLGNINSGNLFLGANLIVKALIFEHRRSSLLQFVIASFY